MTAPLTWRLVLWSSTGTQLYPLDGWSGTFGLSRRIGTYTGCHGAAYRSSSVGGPGATATFQCQTFSTPPGAASLLAVGTSTRTLSGVPLPLTLDAYGAPGCALVNDWFFLVPVTIWSSLQVEGRVPIPADPTLSGKVFHAQFLFLDANVNALGLYTSDGQSHRIAGNSGVSSVFAPSIVPAGVVIRDMGVAIGLF